MAELVTFGDTALQFSPRGKERLARSREARLYADGIESGTAVAATALGAESTWVTKLSDSPLGRQVVGQLREQGVDTEVVWTNADESRQGLVFRESGHPPRDGTVRYDCENTAFASVNPGDLPMDRVQRAEVVFTGASSAVLSEQAATTAETTLRAARGSGVTTALAVDYRPGLRTPDQYSDTVETLVEHLDVLVARERHVRTLFGTNGRPRELAHTLAAEFDLQTVVVAREDRGAVAIRDSPGTNVVHEQEGMETDPVDTSGQHAAFVGGFLQQLARGQDLPEALTYAVATAAIACTVPGPLLTARRDEVESVVAGMSDSR